MRYKKLEDIDLTKRKVLLRLDLNAPDVGKFESGSNIANVEMLIIDPFFCFCIIGVIILAALTTFKK